MSIILIGALYVCIPAALLVPAWFASWALEFTPVEEKAVDWMHVVAKECLVKGDQCMACARAAVGAPAVADMYKRAAATYYRRAWQYLAWDGLRSVGHGLY